MKLINKKYQTGIGLLEILLALVVIAAIIFAAARYYVIASNNAKVALAATRINTLIDASYIWVKGHYNFCGNVMFDSCHDDPNYLREQLISTKLVSVNDTENPWGSPNSNRYIILMSAVRVRDIYNENKLLIEIRGVPTKACASLKDKFVNKGEGLTCKSGNTFIGVF